MKRNQNPASITVRMPHLMQKKLRKMSDDVDRSRNWLILQALNLYIQVYEDKAAGVITNETRYDNGGDIIKPILMMPES